MASKKSTGTKRPYINPQNISIFDRSQLSVFTSRKELGYFSINQNNEFKIDKSSLRYLYEFDWGRVHIDLKKGFDTFQKKSRNFPPSLEIILKWLTKEEKEKPKRPFGSFICWRGLLRKLTTSPFVKNEPWIFVVKKFKGAFYVVELQTLDNLKFSLREDISSYCGFKFEQHLTVDQPGTTPDTSQAVNNTAELQLVYEHQIGKHTILLAGEVDCVSQKDGSYVEIKSAKRYWATKWWAQCYLLGVERLVVGSKNHNHAVTRIENVDVDKLEENTKKDRCFAFLDKLLSFVQEMMSQANEDQVYVFERKDDMVSGRPMEEFEYKVDEKKRKYDEKLVELENGETVEELLKKGNLKLINSIIPAWYKELMADE